MLNFVKYQGAGNDFVMIDNRLGNWDNLSIQQIQHICDRRFGVGADGLIKINTSSNTDFECDYYNSDGSKSFCGNGARCAVAFSKELGIAKDRFIFQAIDGEHEAFILDGLVHLKMNDVSKMEWIGSDALLNTGSPHYIQWVGQVQNLDVFHSGQVIRYNERFKAEGVNVNFIEEVAQKALKIRTYERGVEDETLSCGTGITAAALAFAAKHHMMGEQTIPVYAAGGDLKVTFQYNGNEFTEIWLIGPAERVFEGEING